MGTITAKWKGYCQTCKYTIWQGEKVTYDGKVHHIDCREALLDPTPRMLNPAYFRTMGKAKKSKVADLIGKKSKPKPKPSRQAEPDPDPLSLAKWVYRNYTSQSPR